MLKKFWKKKKNPLDLWISKLDKIYMNFEDRNDRNLWVELLNEDICENTEYRDDVRIALLKYLIENNNISQEIWIILNEYFNFTEDVENICEEFDEDFINNIVIKGIKYKENPIYSLFNIDKNLNYDDFLEKYYELDYAMLNESEDVIEILIKEIDKLKINHPSMQVKKSIYYYRIDDLNRSWSEINKIDDIHQNLISVKAFKGRLYLANQEYEIAEKYFKDVLDEVGSDVVAQSGLYEVYVKQGRLLEAKNIIFDLEVRGYYDDYIKEKLENVNNLIIEKIKSNENLSKNSKSRIELSEAYLEVDDIENAVKEFEMIEPDDKIKLEYSYLATRIHNNNNQKEKAIEYAKEWEKLLESFEINDNEIYNERSLSKSLALVYQSYIYLDVDNKKECMRLIDKALDIYPDDILVLEYRANILFSLDKYEEAVDICNKIIEKNGHCHTGHMIKIESLYNLEEYSDAYDACEEYLSVDTYDLKTHVYKIRCLIECEELDYAEEGINFLESEGVESTRLTYLKARILDERGNTEEAQQLYTTVIEAIESNESDIDFIGEVYDKYAFSISEDLSIEEIIKILDKGLEYDANYVYLLFSKSFMLRTLGKYDKALELLRKIESLNRKHHGVNRAMYRTYIEIGDLKKALEHCNKQIETSESYYDYYERSIMYLRFGDIEAMYKDLQYLENECDSDEFVYILKGLYYDAIGMNDKAIKYYKKAEKIAQELEDHLPIINISMARHFLRLKDFKKAMDYYNKEYDITEDEDILSEAFEACLVFGEFDLAKRYSSTYYYKKSLEHGGTLRLVFDYAKVELKKGNLEKACQDFFTSSSKISEGKIYTAKTLYCIGNYEQALDYMDNNMNSDEEDIRYYIYIGRIHRELGDIEKAKEYAKIGIEKLYKELETKKTPREYSDISALYGIMGEYEKAKAYADKSLESPKCMECIYRKCINAVVEKIYTCKYTGDKDGALDYCQDGLKISPYDEDINYLNRILNIV